MIEQSFKHGSIYLSYIRKSMLVSKSVKVSDIAFGYWRPIEVYNQGEFVYVKDLINQDIYLYSNGTLQIKTKTIQPKGEGFFYYYGVAHIKDERTGTNMTYPYYIQNKPRVTLEVSPQFDTFEVPRTIQDLGYDQEFDYDIQLRSLIGDLQASYVDRFKRPVQISDGRVFPIHIDNATTTFKDLKPSNYPIVINLANTAFAMLDLEPGYTDEDLRHFHQTPGYYIEDTPRGGKHKLVKLDTNIFKYRYSDHLEIINEGMVTIYGIAGRMHHRNPQPLDLKEYTSTVRTISAPVTQDVVSEDIAQYVSLLNEQNLATMSQGKDYARNTLNSDPDRSHGEYVALYTLYMQDIKPYASQIPHEALPWILEAYSRDVIPFRDKHETQRNDVPYLVYLSNEVIHFDTKRSRKVEQI